MMLALAMVTLVEPYLTDPSSAGDAHKLMLVWLVKQLEPGSVMDVITWVGDWSCRGDRHAVYQYYGTFTRAMLTLFETWLGCEAVLPMTRFHRHMQVNEDVSFARAKEITLGNFVPVTRLMMSDVSEIYVTWIRPILEQLLACHVLSNFACPFYAEHLVLDFR